LIKINRKLLSMAHYRRTVIVLTFVLLNIVSISLSLIVSNWFYILFIISFGLLMLSIYDVLQIQHSLLRNFPVIGRLRWIFEHERSKIQQYFVENDLDGTPYNREKRSDVYQKSKKESNSTPFGTQLNVYNNGYEFLKHSIYPKQLNDVSDLRHNIGSKFTKQKYNASIFNISAMSYGSLSEAAIRSLNIGAKMGGFYHNTGEGGISPYHLQGGDLVFQVGTGYFGAGNTINGKRYFAEDVFEKNAKLPEVKMIEIKLSQGAKPGHGGILPAKKNTPEIAKIRGVEKPFTEVNSPSYHTAFSNDTEMLEFIMKVRELSNGKPVGIKMCVGNYNEVESLIKQMSEINMYPDFIAVDGGEGGTGAAPLVYANHMGTPLTESLILVDTLLKKYKLRDEIKIIASGKASTSFDVIRLLALGADGVSAARAFMLSLGCIQARECNIDTCPVGIATQNKGLIKGLDVNSKKVRIYNYHQNLMHEIKEVIASMGLTSHKQLNYESVNLRTKTGLTTYKELYNSNSLLHTIS
jgi:glutamate synthase domain-containing protein 2